MSFATTKQIFLRVLPLVVVLALGASSVQADGSTWAGTWATAVSVPTLFDDPVDQFNDQTIRQIVHISIGGSKFRVRLTNVHGTEPLEIGAANLAIVDHDVFDRDDNKVAVIPRTRRTLKFNGSPWVTIPAGVELLSDPVTLDVSDLSDLAISLFVPDGGANPSSPVSYHVRGLQDSYVLSGNQVDVVNPIPDFVITYSIWLSGVDVMTEEDTPVVVAFGNSLTDGDESTPNTNRRYPNLLANRILKGTHYGHPQRAGVLNLGISRNQLLTSLIGDSATVRFDRDALTQTRVTHIMVLIGINDLGLPPLFGQPMPDANDLIGGFEQLISRARAQGIKIIGGTITPAGGFFLPTYTTPEAESVRNAVNTWIRTSNAFDAVTDFDELLRDPDAPGFIRAELNADGLHPNDDGYQEMADSIDLSLIFGEDDYVCKNDKPYGEVDDGCNHKTPICANYDGYEPSAHVVGDFCATCRNTQKSNSVKDDGCSDKAPLCVDKSGKNPRLNRTGRKCVAIEISCSNTAADGGRDKGCDSGPHMCVGTRYRPVCSFCEGKYCVSCINTQLSHAIPDEGCSTSTPRCVAATGYNPRLGSGGHHCEK